MTSKDSDELIEQAQELLRELIEQGTKLLADIYELEHHVQARNRMLEELLEHMRFQTRNTIEYAEQLVKRKILGDVAVFILWLLIVITIMLLTPPEYAWW